jgi:hypothetical protein
VKAARSKPRRSPVTRLGTKTLADFFIHLTQCYLGDERLAPSFSIDQAEQQQRPLAQMYLSLSDI